MKKLIQYIVTIVLCVYISITCVVSIKNSAGPIFGNIYDGITGGQSLKTIINMSENSFKSGIFQKSKIVRIDAYLTYFLTRTINSVQVLQGKNDWLFYKSETDGDSLADYTGTNFFTEEEMKDTLLVLTTIDETLSKKGISLALMVAPNKENVYSEYMPDDIIKISDKSRTDLLIEYLQQNSDINIVDPKDALLKAKEDFQLYYKYDTHWNQLGGFIGVQKIIESWGLQTTELSQKKVSHESLQYHLSAEDDLAKMAGVNGFFKDEEYKIEGSETVDWAEIEKQGDRYIHLVNNNATYKEKVLLIGDSFRAAMIPELSSNFSDIYIVHRSEYKPEMLDEISPNRVILEYVERYSNEIKDVNICGD